MIPGRATSVAMTAGTVTSGAATPAQGIPGAFRVPTTTRPVQTAASIGSSADWRTVALDDGMSLPRTGGRTTSERLAQVPRPEPTHGNIAP